MLSQIGLDEKQAAAYEENIPLSSEEIKDVIVYMTDIAATIWYLLEVYPSAAEVFVRAGIQTK